MSADNVQRNPALNLIPGLVDTLLDIYRLLTKALNNDGKVVVQNTLWVSKAGNDATALRNRIDKPFLTVQAAVNARQLGDVIHIEPGRYTENVVIPAMPAIIDLTIEGDAPVNTGSQAATVIDGGALAALTWAAGTGKLTLANLGLLSSAPTSLVVVGNVASPDTQLSVQNVYASAFVILFLSSLTITNLDSSSDSEIIDCGKGEIDGLGVPGVLLVRYDQAGIPNPAIARSGYRFRTTHADKLVLLGEPDITFDAACMVRDTIATSFKTIFVGPYDLAPHLSFFGTVGKNVTIVFDPLTGLQTDRNFTDFSGASVGGVWSVAVTAPEAPANFATAVAAGAKLNGGVSSGESVAMNIRGSSVPQALLSCLATGTLDRDSHAVVSAILAPGANLVVFTGATAIPFPPGATYAVTLSAAAAANAVGVTGKAPGGFVATATLAGMVDFTATRD